MTLGRQFESRRSHANWDFSSHHPQQVETNYFVGTQNSNFAVAIDIYHYGYVVLGDIFYIMCVCSVDQLIFAGGAVECLFLSRAAINGEHDLHQPREWHQSNLKFSSSLSPIESEAPPRAHPRGSVVVIRPEKSREFGRPLVVKSTLVFLQGDDLQKKSILRGWGGLS